MKLRHFLDAAYAVLHEEYQRYKMNLFDATEQLKEYAAGYKLLDEEGHDIPLDEAQEAAENARAMAELREVMKNTGMGF